MKATESLRVGIYHRVSTNMQDTRMQKHSIGKFLDEHPNISVIFTVEDVSQSGALGLERPAMNEVYNRIDEIDAILIYDWDRLSREEEFATSLIHMLRKREKLIMESNGNILDFAKMGDRIQGYMKSVWAEEERIRLKRKIQDGIAAKRETQDGHWGRHAYFGSLKPKRKELIKGIRENEGSFRWDKSDWLTEDQFWDLYEKERSYLTPKTVIARKLHMSDTNLYRILKRRPERYNRIEKKAEAITVARKQIEEKLEYES